MQKKWISLITLVCVFFMCHTTVLAENNRSPITEGYFGGHSYQAFDMGMTWEEAKEYCEEMGGHLATITDEGEQKFVETMLGKRGKNGYWLGGCAKDIDSAFEWITGEEFTYSNWGKSQPDKARQASGHEDKVMIYNTYHNEGNGIGHWNDLVNEGAMGLNGVSFTKDYIGFICEWDYIRTSFGSEISEWASDEIEEAYNNNLIPDSLLGKDLKQSITRAEFAAVSVKAYELMADTTAVAAENNPFTDTNDIEVLKAYHTGITTGISATEFSPETLLNREQAATMLTRVFKKVTMQNWSIANDAQFTLSYQKPAAFDDDSEISGWAKDSVYFMVANQIINGVGNNKFAPQNTTSEEAAIGYANATREQALIIATRMVENLK